MSARVTISLLDPENQRERDQAAKMLRWIAHEVRQGIILPYLVPGEHRIEVTYGPGDDEVTTSSTESDGPVPSDYEPAPFEREGGVGLACALPHPGGVKHALSIDNIDAEEGNVVLTVDFEGQPLSTIMVDRLALLEALGGVDRKGS